jgi:hypothetical protein
LKSLLKKSVVETESLEQLNEELADLELSIPIAKEEVKKATEVKKHTKACIKAWIDEFTAREGRAPEKFDKAQIRTLYTSYETHDDELIAAKKELANQNEALGLKMVRVVELEAKAGAAPANAEGGEEVVKAKAAPKVKKAPRKIKKIKPMKTSNVKKYKIGQMMDAGGISGPIVAIHPAAGPGKGGKGTLDIEVGEEDESSESAAATVVQARIRGLASRQESMKLIKASRAFAKNVEQGWSDHRDVAHSSDVEKLIAKHKAEKEERDKKKKGKKDKKGKHEKKDKHEKHDKHHKHKHDKHHKHKHDKREHQPNSCCESCGNDFYSASKTSSKCVDCREKGPAVGEGATPEAAGEGAGSQGQREGKIESPRERLRRVRPEVKGVAADGQDQGEAKTATESPRERRRRIASPTSQAGTTVGVAAAVASAATSEGTWVSPRERIRRIERPEVPPGSEVCGNGTPIFIDPIAEAYEKLEERSAAEAYDVDDWGESKGTGSTATEGEVGDATEGEVGDAFDVFPVEDPSRSLPDECVLQVSSWGIHLRVPDDHAAVLAKWPWAEVTHVLGGANADPELMDDLNIAIESKEGNTTEYVFECEQPWTEVADWMPGIGMPKRVGHHSLPARGAEEGESGESDAEEAESEYPENVEANVWKVLREEAEIGAEEAEESGAEEAEGSGAEEAEESGAEEAEDGAEEAEFYNSGSEYADSDVYDSDAVSIASSHMAESDAEGECSDEGYADVFIGDAQL